MRTLTDGEKKKATSQAGKWSTPGSRLANLAVHAALIIGIFMVIAPFLWTITASLKSKPSMIWRAPYFYPTTFAWENYVEAWKTASFSRFYLNTAIMTGALVLGQVFLSAMAAYAFARLQFFGRNTLFLVFLGTTMIPFFVIMLPSYLIVEKLGWLDTYWALTVPRLVSAFAIFLLRQAFLGIPKELDEAACMDGCSAWKTLWLIIMPLSKPALAAVAIFAFLFGWNDFLWPLLVTRSPEMSTIQIGLTSFQGRYYNDQVHLMAAVTTATIPSLLLFIVAQRYFVRGVATIGLKG